MFNLITGSAERRSPTACDHLSGSLSLALVRGYFSPLSLVSTGPVLSAESCGSSRLEEELIEKTCAQEATRDIRSNHLCLEQQQPLLKSQSHCRVSLITHKMRLFTIIDSARPTDGVCTACCLKCCLNLISFNLSHQIVPVFCTEDHRLECKIYN